MAAPRILVVGNEIALRKAVAGRFGNGCVSHSGHRDALEKVQQNPDLDLLFLEMGKGNGEALRTLSQLRALRPRLPILALAARGNNGPLVEAIRAGAHGCLNMPFEDSELDALLRRHLPAKPCGPVLAWSSEQAEPLGNGQVFICASPAMSKLREEARVLADIDGPVLILGESGTGKEATAQLIHQCSPRLSGLFTKVNCAAFAGELLDTELFGQERGRKGKFELCDKGTILLDEVSEMSPNVQVKLLDVIQEVKCAPSEVEATDRWT